METKDLENHNNPSNWCSIPHGVPVNGTTDYCSLSTSSSKAANLNEPAKGWSSLASEPIHQEPPARSSPEVSPSDVTDENEVVTVAAHEKIVLTLTMTDVKEEKDPFSVESSSLKIQWQTQTWIFPTLIPLLAVILSQG